MKKYRAVSFDVLNWRAQVYVSYVGSNGAPVGWVDIKSSPVFKLPMDAILWAQKAGF